MTGLLELVPNGWILDELESSYVSPEYGDRTLEYKATLSRRDDGGSCLEFVEGTGSSPEAALTDAASEVKP